MTTHQWGADVPVSMPQPLPPELESRVPMGGFTMTALGLFPDMTEADHERLAVPAYAPHDPSLLIQETEPPGEEELWRSARG